MSDFTDWSDGRRPTPAWRIWLARKLDPNMAADVDNGLADAVGWIREAAQRVFGSNCTFVGDDLMVLEHLAWRARDAGLVDRLPASFRHGIFWRAFVAPMPPPEAPALEADDQARAA